MNKIKPRTLSGFMELLPADQLRMDAVMNSLRETYARFGYAPIDTPVIESAEILLAKGGGETEKQIYRFTKGDADLALRFDLTVPLAKYAALHYGELAFPFRRYQIGKVYRGERAQRGRFREFYQADIDIIGDGALARENEAEVVAVICAAMESLGVQRFKVRINNRKVLNGLFEYLGVKEPMAVMNIIDKLDKIGAEKVCELLIEQAELSSSAAERLMSILSSPEPVKTLSEMKGLCPALDVGIEELLAVTDLLPAFGVSPERWGLDLTIARGLDYYTGTVYETTLLDYPEIGSVCSGGRYDNLAEYYTDKPLPGVGVSIGVTRLFYVLQEQGLLNPELSVSPCDALIIPMGDVLPAAALAATELRAAGVRTQLYMEQKKVKAKFSYADKIGAPYAVIIGSEEAANGTVSLKDLKSGEQVVVSAAQAAQIIAEQTNKTVRPVKA